MEYRKAIVHQCVDGIEEDTEVLLPCFADEEQEQKPIGIWGQRHLKYIRKYSRKLYNSLLISGSLDSYLADIDRQAESIMDSTVTAMAKADGPDEALKARDMMKWVRLMNNYRHSAEEIVYAKGLPVCHSPPHG